MRISELVKKLEQLKSEYGDLVVMDFDSEWGATDLTINGVYVNEVSYLFNKDTREVKRENRLVFSLHGTGAYATPKGEK